MGRVSPVSQSTMRLSADLSSRAWLLLPFAFVASLLLGYGVIGLLLWGCESCVSYFIFQPDRTLYAKPSDYSFNVRDVGLPVTVPGDAGQSLHGWWVAAAAWDAKVVLYLHGNDGNVSTSMGEIAPLRELGYAVFMPDYRGYGESEVDSLPRKRSTRTPKPPGFTWSTSAASVRQSCTSTAIPSAGRLPSSCLLITRKLRASSSRAASPRSGRWRSFASSMRCCRCSS